MSHISCHDVVVIEAPLIRSAEFVNVRVILIPDRRYRWVWPPGVGTVTDIVLNTLLLHCYIVTMFY